MAQTNYPNEPVVVVGSGCRFPGSSDTPSKLWNLLTKPRDLRSKVPKDRFDIDAFYHPDGKHHGRTNAPYAYFLDEDLRAFDAPFFNIQAGEADSMDPQHRLLLETVYEAVSNAGMRIQDLQGSSTAVYVGMMTHDYETITTRDFENIPTYAATGVAVSIASNRISYFFDWHGPSMTIDTACSSSLAAVHLAVQQLRSGQSTMAVAAGANLLLGPMTFVMESKLSMLSPKGQSRMWDADANGYARGEGVCSVVLKTLSQALRDGDQIECVIRETGINQDGRTTGITMPSHNAQEALIRSVYDKAGLDITKREDRCQFFEAHGTGTPAGDPQEAEAIASAFFAHDAQGKLEEGPLFVGGIKTVIGHTEGTAGIAGLMKASLAVQHGIIPPNMLFEKLSPRVAPFYKNLKIPTEVTAWPPIPAGQPRRVSVNSFGFGGTNAHAIVEEYLGPKQDPMAGPGDVCSLPLVLSAKSQRSLKVTLESMRGFIETMDSNSDIKLQDLAYTLLRERSVLPFRCAITGSTREAAISALESALSDGNFATDFSTEVRDKPRVLGIFTGQGAQWPGMLRGLIQGMPFVQGVINELDKSLQTLPERYRPSWSLREQLDCEPEVSKVGYASFSQPLCCAVQIVLVRLLAAAGIQFTAVVGHSSGEIACAFAAGLISASQAIRIAYLRGIVSTEYAASPSGQAGAMLAAGMSYDEAQELCQIDVFEDRICVAASNAEDSVTFSGDLDAIQHIQGILEDESTFARLLKVDKAYHSHHMLPCAEPYVRALEECGCAFGAGEQSLQSDVGWYSSVDGSNKRMSVGDVTAQYWKDNLVSPVLFSQAIREAVTTHRSLDVGIEVGPHPALKGPCLSTVKDALLDGVDLAYTGTLQRSKNDLNAFAEALGYLWERFGISSIDADAFVRCTEPERSPNSVSKQLPSYPWDRSRRYWIESRSTRQHLHGKLPHLLLGKPVYSTALTFQWSNFIRPRDIEWLDGHALQGQTVFPAAGYIVMAMEGALNIASQRKIQVQLLEILNMDINKAVVFEDENSMVELNLTAEVTSEHVDGDQVLILDFIIDSCLAKESELSRSARGQLVISPVEESASPILPPPEEEHPHMNRVNIDAFYRELDSMGYDYSKDFRRLLTMKRADSKASGTLAFLELQDEVRGNEHLLLHPAPLDIAFQTVIGAYSSPGDRRLRSLYVPTHIDRIALAPNVCLTAAESGVGELAFNTTNTYDKGDFLSGDIEVFDAERTTLFQVDNIIFKPFSPPTPSTDHRIFAKWFWNPLTPDKLLDNSEHWATSQDEEAIPIIERIVFFHIKSFLSQLTSTDCRDAAPHFQRQIEWCKYIQAEARQGNHQWYQRTWEEDTLDQIKKLCEINSYHPHVRLVQRVGQNLLSVVRGHQNSFDLMDHDGLLTEFYSNTLSFGPALQYAQELVSQIAHRFQSLDILEIGAGTGGATKHILSTPQLGFNSYTFTDISPSFFETAREQFAEFEGRMEFEALDIRRSPAEQGFKESSYDLIIASNVLHATPRLEETMAHARSLLKPGGHMVILEITHREHSRLGFLFGLFPDWWAGVDDGRVLEPFVSFEQWDTILKRVGFSGIDSRTLDRDAMLFPTSVFSSHAVDAKIERLYKPLSALKEDSDSYPPLVVIGGNSSETQGILEHIKRALPHRRIESVKRLQDLLHATELQKKSTFIILSELDEELFCPLDQDKFEAVQSLLHYASHMLWLTENAWVDHPNQASTIGMVRSIRREHPDVGIQVLDVDSLKSLNLDFLVEQVLRLEEDDDDSTTKATWTNEPEVYWCQGRAWVPRLKHDMARNNRMNSTRRPVFGAFDPYKTPITLKSTVSSSSSPTYYLEANGTSALPNGTPQAEKTSVHVRYGLSQAIRIGHAGYLYLAQGCIVDGTKETPVIALSESNASILDVPRSHVYALPSDMTEKTDSPFVVSVAASIVAETIVRSTQTLTRGASMLVLEPPRFCVGAVLEAARRRGVQVHFATTSSSGTDPSLYESGAASWIKFHGRESDNRLKQALPPYLVVFFDMSSIDHGSTSTLGHRLAHLLPPRCLRFSSDYLVRREASSFSGMNLSLDGDDEESSLINYTIEMAIETVSNGTGVTDGILMLPAHQLSSASDAQPLDLSTVVDWVAKREEKLSARISPVDSGRLFVDDKTYLLVGLTGDLGRSLCRWMILHGAKHVVLTSRNPSVDPKWIAHVEHLGGNVNVLSMDIADEASVDAGLAKLRDHLKLPPIGGIAFGPLVLQDVMLKNMDLQGMEMVMRPKVEGARILHERFSEPGSSSSLDFFVMFSSIVAVMGNPGQANYSAANAFLQGLAQQRCARGLAGSTIDIGAVYGVGFVTRAELEEDFNAIRFMFDSVEEHELHTLFAEAVVSGRQAISPQQQKQRKTVLDMSDVELTTGIPDLDPALKDRITFFDDARVGNFKIPEQRRNAGDNASGSKGSVKEQLLQATTLDEVREIVIDSLSEKLRVALQIPAGETVHPTIPLIDQGVDSLGAVTVGTWFSKQLYLDLPLLKVLGGATVADLADDAATRLPPSAIPLVVRGDGAVESSDSKTSTGSETSATSVEMLSDEDHEEMDAGEPSIFHREKLSLTQEYSWKLQQLVEDPTIFNNTIGMFMKGPIDLERLFKALKASLRRHEIFRTGFAIDDGGDAKKGPLQNVLSRPYNKVQILQVSDRAAAEETYRQLEKTRYNIEVGDTLRLFDLYWGEDEHLLVIAYHRLVGDGSTTENLFVEVGQLYDGVALKQPPAQFADLAARQREDLASGKMDDDIAYWTTIHSNPSSSPSATVVLPSMTHLIKDSPDGIEPQGDLGTWHQHEAIARLDPMVAFRIKERSRKHKSTPMQFYLAAYHVLLARLTDSSQDITIGIADTNRTTIEEVSAMGYFANLLPLRFQFAAHMTFGEHLVSTKDRVREAMRHSRVPLGVLLDRLGTGLPSIGDGQQQRAPLFQAVFDYKQGQAESGSIGGATMTEVIASRERTPYDVVLEMSDDPKRDPLITVKLRSDLYGAQHPRAFLDSYVAILSMFSMNPALKLA